MDRGQTWIGDTACNATRHVTPRHHCTLPVGQHPATGTAMPRGRACGTVVDELAGIVSVNVVVSRMRGSFLAAIAG